MNPNALSLKRGGALLRHGTADATDEAGLAVIQQAVSAFAGEE